MFNLLVTKVTAFQVHLLLNTCKSGCVQMCRLLFCSGLWDNSGTHMLSVRSFVVIYIFFT